ncbi:MAG: hypothetical protein ACP5GN_05515, partial [Fervidicoccaceae archaeon]
SSRPRAGSSTNYLYSSLGAGGPSQILVTRGYVEPLSGIPLRRHLTHSRRHLRGVFPYFTVLGLYFQTIYSNLTSPLEGAMLVVCFVKLSSSIVKD